MLRDTLYSILAVSSTKLDFPSAGLFFSLKEIVCRFDKIRNFARVQTVRRFFDDSTLKRLIDSSNFN